MAIAQNSPRSFFGWGALLGFEFWVFRGDEKVMKSVKYFILWYQVWFLNPQCIYMFWVLHLKGKYTLIWTIRKLKEFLRRYTWTPLLPFGRSSFPHHFSTPSRCVWFELWAYPKTCHLWFDRPRQALNSQKNSLWYNICTWGVLFETQGTMELFNL